MNAKIKEFGGRIGLAENESSLQRWLICGPEITRILDEFEGTLNIVKFSKRFKPPLVSNTRG